MKSYLYVLGLVAMSGLAGCQTVTSADLYRENFGLRALPGANFDPAAITSGPYSPFNRKQCTSSVCAPNAQTQWMNEFY
jgi:hypothetical protein